MLLMRFPPYIYRQLVCVITAGALFSSCASFPSQQNLNSLSLGQSAQQVDHLLGRRLTQANVFGYTVITYGYYANGLEMGQTDTLYAIFNGAILVDTANNQTYPAWYEKMFWVAYQDPNTPAVTREAMKLQYEQAQANKRANQQNALALLGIAAQQDAARQQQQASKDLLYQQQQQNLQNQFAQNIAPLGQRTNCTTTYSGNQAYTSCN